jgi:hypothetical protein
MDGIDIIDSDPSTDISLAASCLMAAYFVYSVKYNEKLKNTLTFLEKYILGLSTEKPSVTLQRAYNL